MKVNINKPVPPPSTYDLIGLTVKEFKALKALLRFNFASAAFRELLRSPEINSIYEAMEYPQK